ncbi:ABC transporter permease [Pseudomonas sp. FW215-R2]|jgi:NitT/TauT family transport system permease protein|uniref:ABC transporter permease n=1 Tax=unclassified Pseudomonas TaxID=196821 RepID=UPI000C88F025|nr:MULTISPECIES: ABC transporter permease [unclassified Pseudomonas]PMW99641.1 ABC transporter permease [Pseudomonas sp. FW215-R2]PMX07529.1 ABC transporter permease [Pseudomonas sp. FW215-L1]PMX20362.1 ABC transporter permease [Pseudomonas sp. FW215-E1]PNA27474.1 ABC transporter permease [Pseudomonas sp. FW215-R4]
MSKSSSPIVHGLLGAAGLLGLLLLWWLGVHLAGGGDGLAARFSPQATLASLVELLGRAELYEHVLVSLKRIVVGLLLALLIGVPLGLMIGSYRHLESATTPAFQFLRMISPLSWMPVVVMLMGVGDQPIYFLLTFAAIWPILLNTAAGVRQLDPRWLQLSRSLSATRWETLRKVILPGVLGHVLTGVRLSIGILWIVLVPCEMLGVSAGLGYFILDTRDRLAYSELMAMVLLIGVLGFALDALARGLHRRWAPA